MNEPTPLPELDLETLVRAHLDRQAEQVDPRPGFERIHATLGRSRPAPRRTRFRTLAALAAAAMVLLAFFAWQGRSPVQASAENLVRQAREAHHAPLDRAYLVELRKESELLEEGYPTVPVRVTKLWTRGDRFWIESVNSQIRWAWGRDDRGRVWMAFGPRRATRFEPDEVPRWLNLYCDLLTLKPETLLGEVLGQFDLTREPSASGTQIVRARPRPGQPHVSLRSALLEIDAETKVLRRLTLERTRAGRLVATVTYTLVESQVPEDGKYTLEGHLIAPYEIYTRENQPERRLQYSMRWFGPQAGQWFRLAPRK